MDRNKVGDTGFKLSSIASNRSKKMRRLEVLQKRIKTIMTMTRPCIALVEEPWSSLPLHQGVLTGEND